MLELLQLGKWLRKHFLVEKEQRRERLVLRGSGEVTVRDQVIEECSLIAQYAFLRVTYRDGNG